MHSDLGGHLAESQVPPAILFALLDDAVLGGVMKLPRMVRCSAHGIGRDQDVVAYMELAIRARLRATPVILPHFADLLVALVISRHAPTLAECHCGSRGRTLARRTTRTLPPGTATLTTPAFRPLSTSLPDRKVRGGEGEQLGI